MKHLLALFVLFTVMSNAAGDVCDPHESPGFNPALSRDKIQYKHVRMKAGHELDIGGMRYVLVTVPFVDLYTGNRYAITYPIKMATGANFYPQLRSGAG